MKLESEGHLMTSDRGFEGLPFMSWGKMEGLSPTKEPFSERGSKEERKKERKERKKERKRKEREESKRALD